MTVTRDEHTLTVPRSLGLMAVIVVVLGVGMLVIAWMIADFTGKNLWTTSFAALIFIASGCWMYIFYKNYKVRYNDTEIIVTGANKKTQHFTWSDISGMRQSRWTNMSIVNLKSGEPVGIYWYLTGSDSLIERIQDQLSRK